MGVTGLEGVHSPTARHHHPRHSRGRALGASVLLVGFSLAPSCFLSPPPPPNVNSAGSTEQRQGRQEGWGAPRQNPRQTQGPSLGIAAHKHHTLLAGQPGGPGQKGAPEGAQDLPRAPGTLWGAAFTRPLGSPLPGWRDQGSPLKNTRGPQGSLLWNWAPGSRPHCGRYQAQSTAEAGTQ